MRKGFCARTVPNLGKVVSRSIPVNLAFVFFAAGAQVIVHTRQALESRALDGLEASITRDIRVFDVPRLRVC